MFCETSEIGAAEDCAALKILNEFKDLVANVPEVASIGVPKAEPEVEVAEQSNASTECAEGFCHSSWKPQRSVQQNETA